MKKSILNLAMVVASATMCASASATVYYVSDCQAGAVTGCVAGNDSNAGTSAAAPWRTTTKLAAAFNAAVPGDQFLLAKGGAWAAVSMTLHNTYSATSAANLSAMAANNVIVDSYAPSWYSGTARPQLVGTSNGTVISFFANSGVDGGHTFRNLSFKSPGYFNNSGIGINRFTQFLTFDNISVDGFAGGFTCGGQPTYAYPANITVKNSRFTNSGKVGLGAWGCSNLLIENNTLDGNGFDDGVLSGQPINQNHSFYISGTDQLASTFSAGVPKIASGVTVRGNTVTNSSICPSPGQNGYSGTCNAASYQGQCASSVFVGHDRMSDWVIENNTIANPSGAVGNGCWGISISPANGGYSEYELRIAVRGNKVINPGNQGIEIRACQSCVIENNLVIYETPTMKSNGGSSDCLVFPNNPVSAAPETTYQNSALTVRNNTCWYGSTSDNSTGIRVESVGTAHSVSNNLIVFAAAGTNTGAFCASTSGLTTAAFTMFDYNQCFHASNWASGQSLASWQSSRGFDTHSLTSDPLLMGTPSAANPGNAALQANSPAKNAGSANAFAPRDITLRLRDAAPDIGAFEWASGVVDAIAPAPPPSLTVL